VFADGIDPAKTDYRREQVSRGVLFDGNPYQHKAEIVARDSVSDFDQKYIDGFGNPVDLGNGEYGYVMESLNKDGKLVPAINDYKTLDAYKNNEIVIHNSDPNNVNKENKLMDQYLMDKKIHINKLPDYPIPSETANCALFGNCGNGFYNSNTDADTKAQNAGYAHKDNPAVKVPGALE
jgi:hypothetical protein